MIRILSLFLTFSLLMLSFAGCYSTGIQSNAKEASSGKPEQSFTQTADDEEASENEAEPDYSWFTFPEETNKMTVYSNGDDLKSVLDPAIRIFKEQYPDVEIDYQIFGQGEYNTTVRAEIPAGRGPDLLLLNNVTVQDVYKTMSTGVFENLDPYFYEDGEITLDDYVSGVMDGGLFCGERLIVPLCYTIPLLMTTRALLDEIGAKEADLTMFEGFCETARKYRAAYPDGLLFEDVIQIDPIYENQINLFNYFGLRLIDYENGELSADEEAVRAYADLLKLFYDPDYILNDPEHQYRNSSNYHDYGCVLARESLFSDWNTSFSSYMMTRTFVPEEEGILFFVPPNLQSGQTAVMDTMAAVPKASTNKLNAWRLLKILLSEEIQSGVDDNLAGHLHFWSGQPVRIGSLRRYLDAKRKRGDYLCPGYMFDDYCALWEHPTEAVTMSEVYRQFIREELFPYVRGEASWEDCWKQFVNTLELYKDE